MDYGSVLPYGTVIHVGSRSECAAVLPCLPINVTLLNMPARQAKNWCFTWNNYGEDDVEGLRALGAEMPTPFRYLCWGFEEAPSTGTPHLQGFVSLSERKTRNYVLDTLGSRSIHAEPAKGSPAQNRRYCSKTGDFEEFGECPRGQGARTDLAAVAAAVKEGRTMRELSELDPAAVIRYGAGIMRLRQWFPPARRMMEIHVFWGPPGSGKSRRCWEYTDHSKIWKSPGKTSTGCWFDGYDNHEVAIFDDFNGSWFEITKFLDLTDRYSGHTMVPVKGTFVFFNPAHLFITSNIDPEEWYANASAFHRAAVARRLNDFGTVEYVTSYP